LVQAVDIADAKMQAAVLIAKQKQIDSDWVHHCSRKEVEDFKGQNPKGPKVALIDLGCKENILRELLKRSSAVRIFPSRVESTVIKDWAPNSILLSNGPGDPEAVLKTPETIKDFIGKIPVFGICMGHQVLALSMGAKTYKLKFGHRGANHPIQDLLLNKIYMSSQNHGYAVDETTLPKSVKVTHKNLNDNTVAGFYSEELNCLGIQYHPESHPGPHEAEGLFDFFIEQMHKSGAKVKNGIIENEL
jgi:carbamoyl-phosphate synthase small subunit